MPELGIGGRFDPAESTVVHVPETAVYEDDFFVAGQDHVRLARQVFTVKAISETHAMNHGANKHFRFRIFSANA